MATVKNIRKLLAFRSCDSLALLVSQALKNHFDVVEDELDSPPNCSSSKYLQICMSKVETHMQHIMPSESLKFMRTFGVPDAMSLFERFDSPLAWERYVRNTVIDYVERIHELTFLMTGEEMESWEWIDLYDRIWWCVVFDKHTDFLKYRINFIYNSYYHTREYPTAQEAPSTRYYLGSRIDHFLRLKMGKNHRNRGSTRYALETLFQGLKKGILPLSPSKIVQNVAKHEKAMTATPPPLDESFLSDIEVKARAILKGWRGADLTRCQTESRSASFENRRADGGSCWGMMKLYDKVTGRNPYLIEPEFRGFTEGKDAEKGHYIREIRSRYPDYNEMLRTTMWYQPNMKVRPAFILEPLKVRTVTLASDLGQRNFSTVQKSLWEYLQKKKEFALIGEPLEEKHLREIIQKIVDNNKFYALSGDWSAATDSIHYQVSDLVLECVMEKVYEGMKKMIDRSTSCDALRVYLDFQERARVGFTNSDIVYDNKIWPKIKGVTFPTIDRTVEQTNGQLMGNKLSFPILCMINYIIHWISCERELGRKISYANVPHCLVNGDDYLSVATEKRYEHWTNVSELIGLKKSVGKNFFSREFAQINSQSWTWRLESEFRFFSDEFMSSEAQQQLGPYLFETERHVVLRRNGFCNFGLLLGRGKGMDVDQEAYPLKGDHKRFTKILERGEVKSCESSSIDFASGEAPLWAVYQDLISFCPSTKYKERIDVLWKLQMTYLRTQLRKTGVAEIPLPGSSPTTGPFSSVDALSFICAAREEGVDNDVRFQCRFPEFAMREASDFSMNGRIKRSKQVVRTMKLHDRLVKIGITEEMKNSVFFEEFNAVLNHDQLYKERQEVLKTSWEQPIASSIGAQFVFAH